MRYILLLVGRRPMAIQCVFCSDSADSSINVANSCHVHIMYYYVLAIIISITTVIVDNNNVTNATTVTIHTFSNIISIIGSAPGGGGCARAL